MRAGSFRKESCGSLPLVKFLAGASYTDGSTAASGRSAVVRHGNRATMPAPRGSRPTVEERTHSGDGTDYPSWICVFNGLSPHDVETESLKNLGCSAFDFALRQA